MAEVYGNIGDQPVELSNAATEITLNKLLITTSRMAEKMGVKTEYDIKYAKKLDADLRRLAAAAKQNVTLQQKENKLLKEKNKLEEDNKKLEETRSKSLERYTSIVNKAGAVFEKLTSSLISVGGDLATMGNSLTKATSALNAIPYAGKVLSGTLGLVASAAENTQKSFMDAAKVGANFNASFQEMMNEATEAGLTFSQLTDIISQAGQDVALLRTETESGAKQLVKFTREMNRLGLTDQLANLGHNTESITEALVSYGAQLRLIGRRQLMSEQELAETTADYLTNLAAVSKITGEDRKELEKRQRARMTEARFLAMLQGKDETTQQTIMNMIDTLPEQMRAGAMEGLTTGTYRDPEGIALVTALPQLASSFSQINAELRSGQEIQSSRLGEIYNLAISDSKSAEQNFRQQIGFQDQTLQSLFGGIYQLISREGMTPEEALAKVMEDRDKKSEDGPAALVSAQQELAKTSNEMNARLLTHVGTLVDALKEFTGFLETYIMPLMDRMIENLEVVVAGALAIGVGKTIAETILEVRAAKALFRTARGATTAARAAGSATSAGSNMAANAGKVVSAARMATGLGLALAPSELGKGIKYQEGQITAEYVNLIKNDADTLKQELEHNKKLLHDWENDEKYKKLDQKTREKAIKATVENIEILEKLSKEVKNNTSTVKAASTCELDYSSPQALFNSFAKIMVGGKAGVTDSMTGTSTESLTQRPPSHIGSGTSVFSKDVAGLSDLIYQAEGTADEIAKRHGFKSGYDVTYGYGKYGSTDKPLSEMTVAEVKEYQKQQIAATRGKIPGTDKGTGAVGKGQYTQGTLADLQKEMGFKDTDVFSPELQDQMMAKLLERSGLKDFKSGKITANQFQDRLAGTWASIGKSTTGKSAYNQPTSNLTAQLPSVLAGIKDVNTTTTPSSDQARSTITPESVDNSSGTTTTTQTGSGGTTTTQAGPGAPGSTSTPASNQVMQSEALNTQVAQLIKTNTDLLNVARAQLRALNSMSSNEFGAVT